MIKYICKKKEKGLLIMKKYKYTDRERPLLPAEKEAIRNLVFGMEPREREYILELLLADKENPLKEVR